MTIKKFLRKRGYDIVRYRSAWDSLIVPKSVKTILDIGANDGTFAKRMRAQFPDAQIIAFEPLKDAYEKLIERMQGDAKFSAYNVALGETKDESVIHKSSSDPSSSLLTMASLHKELYPASASHTDETIQIARLDEIVQGVELVKPILIKIDVQGFEAGVIKGGPAVIGMSDMVLVENSFVELYEGQALFGEIHELLSKLGFSYRGRTETHYNEKTGVPIYEDSLFIKQ